ncbi:MAG: sugar phosphate isomerase/epimerase [Bryobacterales bacterium]|nr:sugar phosphate isomerase/epimerase [Bryobacterales bacterium]
MLLNRRGLGKLALGAGAVQPLIGAPLNSRFGGVQVGVITYSFRALPSDAHQVLNYCRECAISAVELMSNVAESYAGAPKFDRPASGAGRAERTPEQEAAMRKLAEETRAWRLSARMDKYKEFRRLYNDAGVTIYAFKLPPSMNMSDAEYDYIWNVAETLGANHVTMELPTNDAHLARVAEYAAKRKLRIAFHTHGQGGESGFERALSASPYTALNFDVGHFYGVTGKSPVPVMVKYHDRIASLHLKDRKAPAHPAANPSSSGGGANMPWGEGGTPLKEILQTMKRNKYAFPASIEYEYQTPAGSDVLAEIRKCVQFCKNALA